MKTESLKLYIRKCFHFKKAIFANLCTNFDCVVVSWKNPGSILIEHYEVP